MSEQSPSLSTSVLLLRQMSHEMRTPLAALINTGDLFAGGMYGKLTEKQQKAADRVQRTSHRVLTILEDFVSYVKAESMDYPLIDEEFEPRKLIAGVISQIESEAKKSTIPIQIMTPDNLPDKIIGDKSAVQRILLALLWNAIAATHHGSITISSEWSAEKGWIINIQDTGTGISKEDEEHIFEAFWRGKDRPQVSTSGCGLGLPLARSLARVMNGNLVLVKTSAEGSLFSVELFQKLPHL